MTITGSSETPVPLAWTIAVVDVPERGGRVSRVASADERAAIMAALGLLACTALAFEGRMEHRAGGRVRITGRLTADVAQACIVTLDPVPQRIDERVTVEFRPEAMISANAADRETVLDYGDDEDVEPIERGQLVIGRVLFEELAASLDPYPRAPGVSFDGAAAAPKDAVPIANPFAVLKSLKPKT